MKQLDLFIPEKSKRVEYWCFFQQRGRCIAQVESSHTDMNGEETYTAKCICDPKSLYLKKRNIISWHNSRIDAQAAWDAWKDNKPFKPNV